MGRRDRSGSVNDTGNSAAGAGWPAALTPAPQRVATFKNGAAHLTNSNFMRARATSGERHTAPRMLTGKAFAGGAANGPTCFYGWDDGAAMVRTR